MEKLGYHKRDLMVSDVKKRGTPSRTPKSNSSRRSISFTKTLNVQGGELQDKYDVLNDEYQQSENARKPYVPIASVEDVSEALFAEWEGELKQYSNASLRQKSQKQLYADASPVCAIDQGHETRGSEDGPGFGQAQRPCLVSEA